MISFVYKTNKWVELLILTFPLDLLEGNGLDLLEGNGLDLLEGNGLDLLAGNGQGMVLLSCMSFKVD